MRFGPEAPPEGLEHVQAVELFGGTVNLKYISVLFCGDDAIDTDEGYQGKIQCGWFARAPCMTNPNPRILSNPT